MAQVQVPRGANGANGTFERLFEEAASERAAEAALSFGRAYYYVDESGDFRDGPCVPRFKFALRGAFASTADQPAN